MSLKNRMAVTDAEVAKWLSAKFAWKLFHDIADKAFSKNRKGGGGR